VTSNLNYYEKNLLRPYFAHYSYNSFSVGANADGFACYRFTFFSRPGATAERKSGHIRFARNFRYAFCKLGQRGGERNGAASAG
jgi:hypothetical protein